MSQKIQVEHIELDKLIPYARNSRTHSAEQVAQIAASIKEFGFTNPVLIDETDGIIAGHGRVMAARKLSLEEVPCIRLVGLTEAQKRAYVIADNKLALNAGWDDEMLALELGELGEAGLDLSLTGFTQTEIDALLIADDDIDEEGLTDPDEAPEVQEEFISKQGDVWILGRHRVMCGDSTKMDHVDQLIAGESCDACWTDPPYNVDMTAKNEMLEKAGKARKDKSSYGISNDAMNDEAFSGFLRDAYASIFSAIKEGAPIYVAHPQGDQARHFYNEFINAGFRLQACLIWVKNVLVLGRCDYHGKHEPILYGWKQGAAHTWYGARNKTTVMEAKDMPFTVLSDGRVQIDMGDTSLVISGNALEVEEVRGTILRAERPPKSGSHPTMKPVDLIIGMLKNSTKKGGKVLDLFGGSGSTLIACEMTGRSARLMELDERYADVIVRRWQDFTGKKAVLEATGEEFPG